MNRLRVLVPATVRGQILWLFGWAFIVVGGINYLGTSIPEPSRTYLAFALDHAPPVVFGVFFCVLGAVCVLTAYPRHPPADQWGYLLGSLSAAGWAVVYICGWLFYDAPARAIGGAVVWLLYAAILTTCARIPRITGDDLIAVTK